jgi:beta-mannanase
VKASIRNGLATLIVASSFLAVAIPASASATIQLGAYTPGAPANSSALSEYTAMVGRQPDIVMWYRDFGQPLLYSDEITNFRATGQTPMATWEPYDQELSQIASGAYDSYLHESAQIAKSWGSTLMIRFGHEMNGTWYPWAGSNDTPEAFVAAWRHVVSLFRADGATNVKWVWAPNTEEGTKYPISPYFPGDSWVDYVGLDGYNWGSSANKWESLGEVFAVSYATVTQLSSKPVIITETSSSETGGDKAAWIRSGFMTTIPQSFPRISAVIWFNKSQEDDWRVNSSTASLEAYRAVVSCSLYGGSGPCEGAAAETPVPTKKKKKGKRLTVRSVHVTHRVNNVASGTVSYGLTQSAQVEIKIVPHKHSRHRIKIVRHSGVGHHKISLARIVRRHLHEGGYRVVVRARNHEGQRSRSRRAHFRVV